MTYEKTPEDILEDIKAACSMLGWSIGMDESKDGVLGLVIGIDGYVKEVLEQLDDGDGYEIYEASNIDGNMQ